MNSLTRSRFWFDLSLSCLTLLTCIETASADEERSLLKIHCMKCHSGATPKGDFSIHDLGEQAATNNVDLWTASLDRVKAGEMPPAKQSQLTPADRERLVHFLKEQVQRHAAETQKSYRVPPRRLNNREFANSVRDVLMIEDVGTHQPTADLIGDSLHEGFDTHGDTLGFSTFHLEQYIESLRKIVDATVLEGNQPKSQRYDVAPTQIFAAHTSQNTKRPERKGTPEGFDFLDPKQLAYFKPFEVVPETGWYTISIRCTGLDRGYYDAKKPAFTMPIPFASPY